MNKKNETTDKNNKPNNNSETVPVENEGTDAPQDSSVAERDIQTTEQNRFDFIFSPIKWTIGWLDSHDGIVTAVATFAIAVFTYFLAEDSSRQARVSNDQLATLRNQWVEMQTQSRATEGQLRMLEQQVADARQNQRAFITASNYKITKPNDATKGSSCWQFQPIIANAGQTPTETLRYSTQVVFTALPAPGKQGSAYGLILSPNDPDIMFQKYAGATATLGPKQELPDTPINDICLSDQVRAYIFAPGRAYARGVIHYRDIYPGSPDHVTKYCFWIQAVKDGDIYRPRPVLCSHWNCTDDECERDKAAYSEEVTETFAKAGQTVEPPLEMTH